MIQYGLRCGTGHLFDAWFQSIATFEEQQRNGLLSCPNCGSHDVDRRPMAPAIAKASRAAASSQALRDQSMEISAERAPHGPLAASTGGPQGSNSTADFIAQLRAYKHKVINSTEDVGAKFADEARKIHYGDSPERPIRGQASREDAVRLAEDGIDFSVLPALPEDHN